MKISKSLMQENIFSGIFQYYWHSGAERWDKPSFRSNCDISIATSESDTQHTASISPTFLRVFLKSFSCTRNLRIKIYYTKYLHEWQQIKCFT
jgi:hypothetical protein